MLINDYSIDLPSVDGDRSWILVSVRHELSKALIDKFVNYKLTDFLPARKRHNVCNLLKLSLKFMSTAGRRSPDSTVGLTVNANSD